MFHFAVVALLLMDIISVVIVVDGEHRCRCGGDADLVAALVSQSVAVVVISVVVQAVPMGLAIDAVVLLFVVGVIVCSKQCKCLHYAAIHWYNVIAKQ